MLKEYLLKRKANVKGDSAKALRNPHLWILLVMVGIVLYLYYQDIYFVKDNEQWLFRYRVFEYKYHLNGILLYIPLIYAALVSGWVAVIVVWFFSVSSALPYIIYFAFDFNTLFYNIVVLTIPLAIILLIALLSMWIKRETKIFAEREKERQAYFSQILKAHEDERKNIARELHDESIQDLVAIANRMQSLIDNNGKTLSRDVNEQIGLSRDTMFRVSEDLRRLSADLRPSVLDDLGLIEALRSLVDKFSTSSARATLVVEGEKRKLPADVDVAVFRFIQEALSNIKRHSGASEAVVKLGFGKETVNIQVQDNGTGIALPEPLSKLTEMNKFGIIGMQERARILDGKFEINSVLGEGTSISLGFRA